MIFHALYQPRTWPHTMQILSDVEKGNGSTLLDVRGLGAVPIKHKRPDDNPYKRHMTWHDDTDATHACVGSIMA